MPPSDLGGEEKRERETPNDMVMMTMRNSNVTSTGRRRCQKSVQLYIAKLPCQIQGPRLHLHLPFLRINPKNMGRYPVRLHS